MIFTLSKAEMGRKLDQYFNAYRLHEFETVQAYYRRKKVLEIIAGLAPKSILEVGSGNHPLFTDIPTFERFCVVEPADGFYHEAVKHREQLPQATRKKITLQQADFESYSRYAEAAFDLVVIGGLLHEVEFPEKILAAAARISSASTIIHINVPNAYSFHRMLAVSAGLIPSVFTVSEAQQQLQQHHTFDMEQLSSLVIKNGFTVIDRGSFFLKPFTHQQMQQMLTHNIINQQILDGLYALADQFPLHGSEIFMNIKLS